jgi:hypothetical protein
LRSFDEHSVRFSVVVKYTKTCVKEAVESFDKDCVVVASGAEVMVYLQDGESFFELPFEFGVWVGDNGVRKTIS